MTAINKELYDALLEAGASEQKASTAAATIKLAEDMATRADITLAKADLQADITLVKADLQAEIGALRSEMYKLVGGQRLVLVLAMVALKVWG
jgi:hypothetical protein